MRPPLSVTSDELLRVHNEADERKSVHNSGDRGEHSQESTNLVAKHGNYERKPDEVASPFMWKKKNGAFFRLVKCTTSRPPWQAATGGMRREKAYQQIGRSA